ncbi:MAG TPA: SpoIIE family protein phosphatase [Polyangiaceae bacterium]|jgi:hypothetical protein
MGTLLRERWFEAAEVSALCDGASLAAFHESARRAAAECAFDSARVERFSELADSLAVQQHAPNAYARLALRRVERLGIFGLELVALYGRPVEAGSSGAVWDPALRLADETDVDVRHDEEACVSARIFAAPVPVQSEAAVVARSQRGESQSGDDALIQRGADTLTLCVADGLGHGPVARTAASAVVGTVQRARGAAPSTALAECHTRLRATRGAVAACARWNFGSGTIEHASAGNVATWLISPRGVKGFGARACVLGVTPADRLGLSDVRVTPSSDGILVMYSDGIASEASLDERPILLRAHPIAIADYLSRRFGTDGDDSLVLVARSGVER